MRRATTLAAILLFLAPAVSAGPRRWLHWLRPDKREAVALGVMLAAIAADVESGKNCYRASPNCIESNSWVYGRRPSRLRSYSIMLPAVAGLYTLSHAMRKYDDPFLHRYGWLVVPVIFSVGEGITIRDNVRLAQSFSAHQKR